jgi:hypothetical protein
MHSQKKGNANPSNAHSSRFGSTAKNQKTSGKGNLGLSVGQVVPMKMFNNPPTTIHSQVKHVDANKIKKAAKGALAKGQKRFMGL